jgi:hypothetical protein
MKNILMIAAVFLLVLVMTYVANDARVSEPNGVAFSLKAHQVVSCNANQIILADKRGVPTTLDKGEGWPECSSFQLGQYDDFYLSRGAKTKFEKLEQTAWWRKAM